MVADKPVHHIFCYGTLKRGEPNHWVMTNLAANETVEFVCEGLTSRQFPLVIATRFNIPFLLNVEGQGQRIYGEVYRVNASMLERLDEFESCPSWYQRGEEEIEIIGSQLESLEPCQTSDDGKKIVRCQVYYLERFNRDLLELPFHERYSSFGDHGLQYKPRDRVEDTEQLITEVRG